MFDRINSSECSVLTKPAHCICMLRGRKQAVDFPQDSSSNAPDIQGDDVFAAFTATKISKASRINERYIQRSRERYLYTILYLFLEGTRVVEVIL